MTVPVITIDGPTASGKGTISRRLAQRLGWRLLDSGALYRLVALAASRHGIALDDIASLQPLAAHLDVEFVDSRDGQSTEILLEGEDVTDELRAESCGEGASRVALLPVVREALLARQRAFCQPPGLVADGRDMGTVVFPAALLKIFLTASTEVRAERRYKQLMEKGFSVTMRSLFEEIAKRDERDRERATAPLKPAADAVTVDSTALGIDDVVEQIWQLYLTRSTR